MIDMHTNRNDRAAHGMALERERVVPTRLLDRVMEGISAGPGPSFPRMSDGRIRWIESYWRRREISEPRDIRVAMAHRHVEALIAEIRRHRAETGTVDQAMDDIHGDGMAECDSNGEA